MEEVRAVRYTAVPCPRRNCYTNPGQDCSAFGSHRERRQLWEAIAQAQDRGEIGVHWTDRFGGSKFYQVQTRLRR